MLKNVQCDLSTSVEMVTNLQNERTGQIASKDYFSTLGI